MNDLFLMYAPSEAQGDTGRGKWASRSRAGWDLRDCGRLSPPCRVSLTLLYVLSRLFSSSFGDVQMCRFHKIC